MNLKELLGNKYREDMTAAEVADALVGYDPTAGMIRKETFDKTASELAAAKKQLKEKMTADEAAEAERKAKEEEMASRLAELERDKAVSEHKARLLGLGYEESLAADTAKALAEGNMDAVFANQKKHLEAQEKALRAQLLQETPKPPAGSGGDVKIDYAEEIQAAQAAGDFSKAAYYTRLQGMEDTQNE